MQGSLWVALLRRIPADKHELLVVTTTTGVELMVAKLLRMEPEFLLLRARLSGSTDQGRIIILPYEQINSIAFAKVLPEAEVQAMFGNIEARANFSTPAALEPSKGAVDSDEAAAETDLDEQALPNAPDPQPARPAVSTVPKPSKSILLARLRARLSGDARVP